MPQRRAFFLRTLKIVAAVAVALAVASCGGGDRAESGAEQFATQMRALGALPPSQAAPLNAGPTVTADMVIDWAEFKFRDLFPKALGVRFPAVVVDGVTYNARAYPVGGSFRYLGITPDGRVFGLGDFTNNALQQFESTTFWSAQVMADQCAVNPATCAGPIPAAFPRVGGVYQLPDYPSTRQLTWVLAQLAASSTSIADINARFSPEALATTSAAQWQMLLQQIRSSSPGAVVVDLILSSPTSVTALIGTPGNPATGRFLNLSTRYAGTGLINALTAPAYALNGSVQFSADRALTMAQAADKFLTLAPGASVLVARINNHQCLPIEARSSTTPRAIGSIFKVWVLGATAQAVQEGAISPSAVVQLVAANRVLGSAMAAEPVGTPVPLSDMATLMMGISDNTATDHLHRLVGRTFAEAQLARFNNANPGLMTPFLSVNENFNLLHAAPAAATAYINGTPDFRRNYVNTVLVPQGPWLGGPSNFAAFIPASWQASALDVCEAYAGMRRFTRGSEAMRLADRALSAGVAQPFVRNEWERVWYKGGTLVDSNNSKLVLAHSWLLETESRGTFVVVALANNPAGGIDEFQVQSVTGRILQLVKAL